MSSPFSAYHSVVAFTYLALAIVFAMTTLHPVYVGLSLIGAFASALVTRGVRATACVLPWVVLLWLAISLCNFVFSPAGATELFSLGERSFSLEALVYGVTMGGLFAAMTFWFMVWSSVMNSEALVVITGKVAPLVTLMTVQVIRLVPQFLQRGREVRAAQEATSVAIPRTQREKFAAHLRVMSVLMGWGMEDSIVRGDSMRARGWGCGIKRTRYLRERFAARDAVMLVAIVLLAAINIPLMIVACEQFTFYPYFGLLMVWWVYLPYIFFLAIPLLLTRR